MFYRRKVILSLLQLFDGQLEKIRLQKLLFLFTKQQQKAEYNFINSVAIPTLNCSVSDQSV